MIDTRGLAEYLAMDVEDEGGVSSLYQTLAEHKKTCEAKPGNCPYEKELKRSDDSDDLSASEEKPKLTKNEWHGKILGQFVDALEDVGERYFADSEYNEQHNSWVFDGTLGKRFELDDDDYDIESYREKVAEGMIRSFEDSDVRVNLEWNDPVRIPNYGIVQPYSFEFYIPQ